MCLIYTFQCWIVESQKRREIQKYCMSLHFNKVSSNNIPGNITFRKYICTLLREIMVKLLLPYITTGNPALDAKLYEIEGSWVGMSKKSFFFSIFLLNLAHFLN